MKMKLVAAIAISSLCMSNAYCADLGVLKDVAATIKSLTSKQGNLAVGVNTGKGAQIEAEADGNGSEANAGIGVISSNKASGQSLNLAVGVNTGDDLKIKAKAGGGGVANAGLGVIHQK